MEMILINRHGDERVRKMGEAVECETIWNEKFDVSN